MIEAKPRQRSRSLASRLGWVTRRRNAEIIKRANEKASKVEVRACIECRSRQACKSNCRLAPWNLETE